MTIEELAKEYANKHLDVSEELGCYLVKSVFLDGAEYQREKQDEFAIDFLNWALSYKWLSSETSEELLKIYKKIKGL
jgi:hypothetical protein